MEADPSPNAIWIQQTLQGKRTSQGGYNNAPDRSEDLPGGTILIYSSSILPHHIQHITRQAAHPAPRTILLDVRLYALAGTPLIKQPPIPVMESLLELH